MIGIQMGTVQSYGTGSLLGLDNLQIIQVTIEGDKDASPAILINPTGDESAPKKGDRVLLLLLGGGNFRLAIGGLDSNAPQAATGEKKLYSRDGTGAIAAFIMMLSSGNLQLNGTGDFAVRFSALESGFNQFVSDFNAHTHPANGSPPLTLSTASISGAKINTIEVPS